MPVGENHLATVHDAAHSQINAAIAFEIVDSSLKLVQKRAAYQACAQLTPIDRVWF